MKKGSVIVAHKIRNPINKIKSAHPTVANKISSKTTCRKEKQSVKNSLFNSVELTPLKNDRIRLKLLKC
jgi:hypothetical protein